MGTEFSIDVEGAEQLERLLGEIIAEDGPKSVNKAMRQATRAVCKEILLPAARDLIPVDTGELEDQLTVRAVKGKRSRLGHSVGFRDPLFTGDTFYGGFIEFGFTGRDGIHVPADSFLRRPLYEREVEVRRFVTDRMRSFIRDTNRHAPDRL